MEPDHPIIIGRLAGIFLCGLPAVRELYQYVNDPRFVALLADTKDMQFTAANFNHPGRQSGWDSIHGSCWQPSVLSCWQLGNGAGECSQNRSRSMLDLGGPSVLLS